jgi:anti-sigma factor RsiW
MIFHLGSRVGALVDGQLPPAQAERAWAHVHSCSTCRDAVEREGWIKRELACLSFASTAPPRMAPPVGVAAPLEVDWPPLLVEQRPRKYAGLAALGAGSLGAAMFGVLVLGAVPGETPGQDRRLPVTNIDQPVSPSTPTRPRTNDQQDAVATLGVAWVRMAL